MGLAVSITGPVAAAAGVFVVPLTSGSPEAFALHVSPDYIASEVFADKTTTTMYAHQGVGVWVAFTGVAIAAFGGVLVARPPSN